MSEEDKSSVDKIEKAFKKFCSKVKVDSKEHRLVKKHKSFFFHNLILFLVYSVIISVHWKHRQPMQLAIYPNHFHGVYQLRRSAENDWQKPIRKFVIWNLVNRGRFFCCVNHFLWFCFLEKQIDVNSVDLNKLKVKDLKKILTDWDEPADYYEKSEFIKRINEVKHKYVKPPTDTNKKDLWFDAFVWCCLFPFVNKSNLH